MIYTDNKSRRYLENSLTNCFYIAVFNGFILLVMLFSYLASFKLVIKLLTVLLTVISLSSLIYMIYSLIKYWFMVKKEDKLEQDILNILTDYKKPNKNSYLDQDSLDQNISLDQDSLDLDNNLEQAQEEPEFKHLDIKQYFDNNSLIA